MYHTLLCSVVGTSGGRRIQYTFLRHSACVYMCVCIICVFICMYADGRKEGKGVHMHARVYACMRHTQHIYMHTCMCAHTCTHVYIYMCVCGRERKGRERKSERRRDERERGMREKEGRDRALGSRLYVYFVLHAGIARQVSQRRLYLLHGGAWFFYGSIAYQALSSGYVFKYDVPIDPLMVTADTSPKSFPALAVGGTNAPTEIKLSELPCPCLRIHLILSQPLSPIATTKAALYQFCVLSAIRSLGSWLALPKFLRWSLVTAVTVPRTQPAVLIYAQTTPVVFYGTVVPALIHAVRPHPTKKHKAPCYNIGTLQCPYYVLCHR
jgi:hypothetical protein